MQTLKQIIAKQQRDRAPQDDPLAERLMAEIIRLAEEVCVARDRLDTCLLLAAGQVDDAAIDAYSVSDELIETRLNRHREFFEDVFERLTSESP